MPESSMRVQSVRPVVAAWSAFMEGGHDLYIGGEGVSNEEPAAYAAATGGRLPRELELLCRMSSAGFEIPSLAIGISAWPPEEAAATEIQAADAEPLPDQLQVFGGDLGDKVWAFWLQRGGRSPIHHQFS